MSTMSICSIEDVHEAVREPFWFQLYLMRDRGFNQELIARARAAQCSALMLTVDLQVQGIRRRDAHNGLSIPPRLTVRNALDMASKPAWALGVLSAKRRSFGNLTVRLGKGTGMKTLSEWIGSQFDPAVTWKEVDWIRSHWPGKLIIKGILDPEDAQVAAGLGIDAMVVSNHGGRQLDGAPSSISVLAEIAEATAGRCEVWFDGGIQSGQDMLRAIALGASACLIGKSYLYAMGAMGGPGVTLALNILRKELEVTLALTGCTDVRTVDASILRRSMGKAQSGASMRQVP
jgi:L-lactate dehydrogenase (cytochrome)